jgi:hypothetical protein
MRRKARNFTVFAALLVLAAGVGGGTGSAHAATAPNGQIAYSS